MWSIALQGVYVGSITSDHSRIKNRNKNQKNNWNLRKYLNINTLLKTKVIKETYSMELWNSFSQGNMIPTCKFELNVVKTLFRDL